jgi:Fe-S-cluster containining protein
MDFINQRNTPKQNNDLRREIAEGLLYTHSRLNANTGKTLEAASFLYALVELMTEKGLISVAELDARKQKVGQRLAAEFQAKAMGALLQDPEYDKYTFQDGVAINCRERVHLCHGACCRIPFALSKQDVREGHIRWELGQPYLIAHGQDGYCEHFDRQGSGCTVYEKRPVPCRGFDCSKDSRIWSDFETMVPKPDILRDDWPGYLAQNENASNGSNIDGAEASCRAQATKTNTHMSKT